MSIQGVSEGGEAIDTAKRSKSIRKTARSASNGALPTEQTKLSPDLVVRRKSFRPQGERTVKRLRLSKALTIPDSTTVADACRRMVTRRVDAALLTDSNARLCGIITDKDISTRVIAEGLKPEETSVSKVMTKYPVFVMSDTLAVEALQKMVQGNFRHLPVVEEGEVIAILDITKCLYDAIARVEGAAEKGNAIATAIESVEREWSVKGSDKPNSVENLRDRMFRPTLGSLIGEGTEVPTCSSSETVTAATKKMKDLRMSSVIVTSSSGKPTGILTSKDVLMKVIAQSLPPESTTVDKVMSLNPQCAGLDTTLVDALHAMHVGKFLHLPVVDSDGFVVACVDVLQLTHGALANVGGGGAGQGMATTMLQKFWDSAMEPGEDESDSPSDNSARQSDAVMEKLPTSPSLGLGNSFSFKLKLSAQDGKPYIYRFNSCSESLRELMSTIAQRVGDDVDPTQLPRPLYIDDEGNKKLLATDSDVVAAVNVARISGWKALTLHLEESLVPRNLEAFSVKKLSPAIGDSDGWSIVHTTLITCTVAAVAVSVVLCYRRFKV